MSIRGIRQPAPANTVLGRGAGKGAPGFITIEKLGQAIAQSRALNQITTTVRFKFVAAPTHSNSSGTKNTMAYDTQYLYLCVATNTWARWPIGDAW